MTKSLIVLLSGWAGSGKDAAAALLIEEMQFDRRAFADPLKEEVSLKTGIPVEIFHTRRCKDSPICGDRTPRQLLLEHARVARATDPDIYTRRIAESIRKSNEPRFVISDWRYRREYEFLAQEEATILRGRIVRSSVTPSIDPSEHDLDNESFDFTIVNDGCISDLRDNIKSAVRHALYYGTTGTFIHVGS